MVIFPRIGWREPTSDVVLYLVTYKTTSVIPVAMEISRNILRLDLLISLAIFCMISNVESITEFAQFWE